jgi:hypothetical protein
MWEDTHTQGRAYPTSACLSRPKTISGSCYPQFHIAPIGVQVQHGPKLPPL